MHTLSMVGMLYTLTLVLSLPACAHNIERTEKKREKRIMGLDNQINVKKKR